MAYKVIESRISQMGFCCPYSYLYACRHMATPDIAAELVVHKRSVRRWRASFRNGTLTCAGKSSCLFKEAQKTPSKCPYVSPVLLQDLDLALDAEPLCS